MRDAAHAVFFARDVCSTIPNTSFSFITVDLHLGPGPFAEQDSLAGFQLERDELTVLIAGAGPHRHDLALLRLFLRGVRNDDAAGRLLVALEATHDHAIIMEGNA
jgi:hypothetical protein